MLLGLIVAYPQPAAMSISVEDGPAFVPPPNPPNGPKRFVGAGSPGRRGKPFPPKPPPNIISTGTGLFAFAGVTSVIWMSTLMAGQPALSTCPTNCFAATGMAPTTRSVACITTVQVTFGTFFG